LALFGGRLLVTTTAKTILGIGHPIKGISPPSLLSEIQGYWSLILGSRRRAIAVLCIAVAGGLSEAVAISLFPRILEAQPVALPLVQLPAWAQSSYAALALFLCVSAVALTCGYLSDEWSWNFRTNVEGQIRLSLLEYFEHLQWGTACQTHSCRIHRSFTTEAYEIANGAYSLIRAAVAAITLIGLLTVVAVYSIQWCLILTLVAAALMTAFLTFHKRSWAPLSEGAELLSNAIERLGDTWSTLKYSRSTEEFGFVKKVLAQEIEQTTRVKQRHRVLYPRIAYSIRMVCLFALGIFLISALNAGLLQGYAWIVPLAILYRMVPHVVHMHAQLHDAHTAYPWILSYEQIQSTSVRDQMGASQTKGAAAPEFEKQVVLHQVSFRHPGAEDFVFEGASFVISKGQRIGITGPSGSGKSTLLDLVTGLLRPTTGTLTIDGVPFQQLDLAKWRQRISIVAQEPLLFRGSVEQNILWGQGRDAFRLEQAVRQAGLQHWLNSLPMSLEAPIGELGKTLSRGQQQRIAIARALYRNPRLLILDEPTNALDALSYKAFCDFLSTVTRDVTVLLVTHDLNLLKYCDARFHIQNQEIHAVPAGSLS
jgi:ABC-type multidrug transport system fused ATPase/permease subunit